MYILLAYYNAFVQAMWKEYLYAHVRCAVKEGMPILANVMIEGRPLVDSSKDTILRNVRIRRGDDEAVLNDGSAPHKPRLVFDDGDQSYRYFGVDTPKPAEIRGGTLVPFVPEPEAEQWWRVRIGKVDTRNFRLKRFANGKWLADRIEVNGIARPSYAEISADNLVRPLAYPETPEELK